MSDATTLDDELDEYLDEYENHDDTPRLTQTQRRTARTMTLYRQYRRSIEREYTPDGVTVDPMGALIAPPYEPLSVGRINTYGLRLPKPVHWHLVWDIETWRLNASRLHIGYIRDLKNKRLAFEFRTWDSPTVPVEQRFLPIITSLCRHAAQVGHERVRIWGHNASGFDCLWIKSNLPSLSYGRESVCMSPSETEEMRWSIVLMGNRQVLRLDYKTWEMEQKDPNSKRKNAARKRKKGSSQKVRIDFVDSYWHLPARLKEFGSKGITPEQYTRPTVWLEKQGRAPTDVAYWFDHVDPAAAQYNRDDVDILCDALNEHEANIRELFPQLNASALDFFTIPKMGLAGAITLTYRQPLPGLERRPLDKLDKADVLANVAATVGEMMAPTWRPDYLVMRAKSRVWERSDQIPEATAEHPTVRLPMPLAPADNETNFYCENGWYCYEPGLLHVAQAGGRCEVFAPMNRPDTNVICVDFRSHYPSVQVMKQYTDLRMLKTMPNDLVGRQAILDFLQDHGGTFLVVTKPSRNPLVKKYPILWTRVAGANPEERLIFPSWEGRAVFTAMAPELKLFVEMGEIEDDDIRIIGDRSVYAPLLPLFKGPFYAFGTKLYAYRKKARDAEADAKGRKRDLAPETGSAEEQAEIIALLADLDHAIRTSAGKSQTAKITLNGAGFGTSLQQNSVDKTFAENDYVGIIDFLENECAPLDPTWEGWDEYDKVKALEWKTKEPHQFLREFFRAQYLTSWSYRPSLTAKCENIVVNMPSELAPHALRPWGCECTSHARAELVRQIYRFAQAQVPGGAQIMYCDTDSIYAAFSATLSTALIEAALIAEGVKLGADLGDMALEDKKADDYLVVPGAKVNDKGIIQDMQMICLGPKNYHLHDGTYILKSVMKGIPKTVPTMRSALFGWSIRPPRLGERIESPPEVVAMRDALASLANDNPDDPDRRSTARFKRHYRDAYSSEPLILKPLPAGWRGHRGDRSILGMMRHYGAQQGDNTGILEAVKVWRGLRVPTADRRSSRTVAQERIILRAAYNKVQQSILDYQYAIKQWLAGEIEQPEFFDSALLLDRLAEQYGLVCEYSELSDDLDAGNDDDAGNRF